MSKKATEGWLKAIGAVAIIGALSLHFKERNSYRCSICFSTRDETQWRLGLWAGFSLPLTPNFLRVSESRFLHDFFPAGHIHAWRFAQGSPYYFFGMKWGGCAIGGGRHVSEMSHLYASSPEFRSFIQKRLQEGVLSKSTFIALTSIPLTKEPSPLREDEAALLAAFYAR